MTVTASSGSTRVAPQRYDTLPLSSVRQAEQQDRFPDGGELQGLSTFFQSGQLRVQAARRLSDNAEFIVAKAANRIFSGGTPLSYLDGPIGSAPKAPDGGVALAAESSGEGAHRGRLTGLPRRVQHEVQLPPDHVIQIRHPPRWR